MARILVIEDEEPIRESIMDTLELEGYEVEGAGDGVTGVGIARQSPPDLIVCDIMMKGMDGFGVLEALQGDPVTKAIPFIFVTAKADRETMRHGMQMGADDYLTKPFTSSELLQTINTRLERHRDIAQRSEERLEGIRQRLMKIITDEVHVPLETINSVVELISRQASVIRPDDLQELLDTITVSSRNLNRVVEQLMLMTRLETGGISQETIAAEDKTKRLWEVLIAAIDMARFFVPERSDVSVQLNKQNGQAVVRCEPGILKHALAEIIANALHSSPKNGNVVASLWSADNGVWISITDAGPGISESQLQQILVSSGQPPLDSQKRQGLGLGLPLARQIIEVHSGKFDIRSEVGSGTEVIVGLPAV